jgi:hypothetical protein
VEAVERCVRGPGCVRVVQNPPGKPAWADIRRGKALHGNDGGKERSGAVALGEGAGAAQRSGKGGKRAGNHLAEWTREDWGTRSSCKSTETGEPYLPRTARAALSETEYRRTTGKKRTDARKGRQFSPQPKDVARKAASSRGPALAACRGPDADAVAKPLQSTADYRT